MKNKALIDARKSKGLTQENLAELLGCQKSSVSNWENGHSNPTLIVAFKLGDILGKDINHLFRGTYVQDSHTKIVS